MNKIGRTTKSYFFDARAVSLTQEELERNNRIKTYFQRDDKIANIDGYFEILSPEGIPLKRFVVQIKGQDRLEYKKTLRKYAYSADSGFFQYMYQVIDSNPGMFFVAERTTGKVYFKYVSWEYLEELSNTGKLSQGSFAIHFDDTNVLSEEQFYGLCSSIKNDRPQRFIPAPVIPTDIDFKSIRKLSANLWINWKTGCLTADCESALASEKREGEDSGEQPADASAKEGSLPVRLRDDELRLLSVLVQGEGSVVSFDELYRRGVLMSQEMDESQTGKKRAGSEEAADAAVRRLCEKAPALRSVIEKTKSGTGWRLLTSEPASKCADNLSKSEREELRREDWDALAKSVPGEGGDDLREAWLRRYYEEAGETFETRISNAGGSGDTEKSVFGDYKMARVYVNADGMAEEDADRQALLDLVENWYKEGADIGEAGGRVLILHGQPGDGKTTFCRKAVYAHRFEGWLKDAPDVIRISLNPNDSSPKENEKNEDGGSGGLKGHAVRPGIVNEGKLNLPGAFCIPSPQKKRCFCDPASLKEGTLVILDGYDELESSLSGDSGVSTFRKFHGAVKDLARDWRCSVIITSRTMCIEEELKERWDRTAVSFAPMDEKQQELMIERMSDLDRKRRTSPKNKTAEGLESYWPKLRGEQEENEDLKKLMAIPILFRMIVVSRFTMRPGEGETTEQNGSEGNRVSSASKRKMTEAELYSRLFYSLMAYKDRDDAAKKELLKEYEKIAAGIFNYNEDTCPFSKRPGDRELIYLFLTKSSDKEKGQMGFLHGAFRQYFLARYILSGIRAAEEARKASDGAVSARGEGKAAGKGRSFGQFFSSLGAFRISSRDLVWRLLGELAVLSGTERDPFREEAVSLQTISDALHRLDDESPYAKGLRWESGFVPGPDAAKECIPASQNAAANLIKALAVTEKACRERQDEGTPGRAGREAEGAASVYGGGIANLKSFCGLLRSGRYSGLELEGWDLRRCDLQGARIDHAGMAGAKLEEAILSESNLRNADLKKAHLENAHLEGADLRDSNLREAHLENARLEGADLRDADLREAHLENAHLEGADLRDSDLREAHLENAHLEDADLRNSDLRGAHLENAHLDWAKLECANLSGAHLDGACLERSCMDGAVLIGAVLRGAKLDGASMRGAYLDSWKRGEDGICVGAEEGGAILEGSSLAGTDLTGAFLSGSQYGYAVKAGALGLPPEIPDGKLRLNRENGRIPDLHTERTFTFGSYPQEPNRSKKQGEEWKKSPITWRILRREYDKVLIVSEKLIDCRVYHPKREAVTWEKSGLRKWLNEVFIKEAFNEEERALIAAVYNLNPDNPRWNTEGGNPTRDRVFALSVDEAKAYFRNGWDRMAAPTPYAVSRGSYQDSALRLSDGTPAGWWWLRSPGFSRGNAACVFPGGVDVDGNYVHFDDDAVRPALWLNL